MISLDKAKALKEAGLEWAPKTGDFYWFELEGESCRELVMQDHPIFQKAAARTWLPRLDQLLAEITKSPFVSTWQLNKHYNDYNILLNIYGRPWQFFSGPTPEDVAADAVAWLLQQKGCE